MINDIHQPTIPLPELEGIQPATLHVDKIRQAQARAFMRRLMAGEEQPADEQALAIHMQACLRTRPSEKCWPPPP